MEPKHSLVEEWRRLAAQLREGGAAPTADIWDLAADRVEAYERERALEALPLGQAAEESGYSPDHLARLVRTGRIPNAGRAFAPLIRRGDLPRKPGGRTPPPRTLTGEPDLVARAHGDEEG
jgi:hypothetical protein